MTYNLMKICLKCTTVLIFLLFFQVVRAQYDFTALDVITGDKKQQTGGNASVIIWKDGNVIYRKDTGSFKMGKLEVQVPIGAASKWFTVALTMKFVEEGLLSLDDPVSDYLPVFSNYSKGYVTIRQCLNNTTGIESDPGRMAKMLQRKKFASLEEEVNYYAAHNDIAAIAGTEFYYGNSGINIVGRVLEVISKRKTFDRLANEKIFRPLGMRKTSFMVETGAVKPASGAVSTAADYSKFLAMLMNKGEFNGKQILSEKSIAEIHKVQTTNELIKFMPPIMKDASYGFGVFLEENGTVISCPSFTGIRPFIDTCRKYACVIFTTPSDKEPGNELYSKIKAVIDEQIVSSCR